MKSITKLNYKSLLAGFFTLACASSCQLDESQSLEVQESEEVHEATTLLSGLLFSEDFEGSNPLKGIHTQGAANYSLNFVSNRAFQGDKSVRFELRSDDDMVANGTRSEVLITNDSPDSERWYSFAVYFPEDGYKYDRYNELISQWKQSSGGPALSLRTAKDQLYIRVISPNGGSEWKNINLGPIIKDTWSEFTFRINHSSGRDGLVEIWRDGLKVLSYEGPNLYKGLGKANWKVGIYKSIWNSKKTDTDLRVLYMDNIRLGDSRVNLSDLVTGSVLDLAQKVITDAKETKLIIANADTETLWEELHPGKIIYFSRLGTQKFSVYADVDDRIKSVSFDLYAQNSSGKYDLIYSSVDKGAPFLLFGDNGKGNYYFGNTILEPGRYKISVGTYADEKGIVPVGDIITNTFKIYGY